MTGYIINDCRSLYKSFAEKLIGIFLLNFQICLHSEQQVCNNNCYSVCSEYVGGMLKSVSNGYGSELHELYPTDSIHKCHIGADFHLLLVWK